MSYPLPSHRSSHYGNTTDPTCRALVSVATNVEKGQGQQWIPQPMAGDISALYLSISTNRESQCTLQGCLREANARRLRDYSSLRSQVQAAERACWGNLLWTSRKGTVPAVAADWKNAGEMPSYRMMNTHQTRWGVSHTHQDTPEHALCKPLAERLQQAHPTGHLRLTSGAAEKKRAKLWSPNRGRIHVRVYWFSFLAPAR